MGNELIQKYAFEAVDLIRKKEVSSSELLKASQERHIEVDEQVNALPYTFYDKALTKAKNIKHLAQKYLVTIYHRNQTQQLLA